MKLSDITVEVRNVNLTRVGLIRPEELHLEAEPEFNNVGTWKLRLSAEHPLAAVLRTPGAGVIVNGPTDVLFSGPVTEPETASTPEDPMGSVTVSGITDEHVLHDALAYPKPSTADVTAQTVAHDERTGPIETLMHAYVNANVGPSAPTARRVDALVMGTNLARGATVTKKPRFKGLGELLTELATLGGFGFRVVQRGNTLSFETYAVADRTAEIRLDARNGTLSGQRVSLKPPAVTRVIVAGQGEGENRTFIERTSTDSLAAETEWSRRIERFVDQRNTDDTAELQQAGDEVLAEDGMTVVSVQAVATEDSSMEFGRDWKLGDKVTVVVEDQELTSVVTGMVMRATSDGFKVGALLGDAAGFNREATYAKRLAKTTQRVDSLERKSAGGSLYYRGTFSPTGG